MKGVIKEDLLYPDLSYKINGVLFTVFKELGPGHHEKYYQIGIAKGFEKEGIKYKREVPADLVAYNEKVGRYFLDFLVDGIIVLEIKRGKWAKDRDFQQIKRYLQTTKLKLGLLAIFKSDEVKIYRIVNWEALND